MQNNLQKIQEFSIRLYFDEEFCTSYEVGPLKMLGQFGMTNNDENLFPNVQSSAFKVESYGRKFLIAKELLARFNNFFCSYMKNEIVTVNEVVNSPLFKLFLQSSEFYTKESSFPHYAGIGKGHENFSKFYLFLKEKNLCEDNEFSLFLDISLLLNKLASLSDLEFYKNFKKFAWFCFGQDIVIVKNGNWLRVKGDWNMENPGNIHAINYGALK
ncbi:MAG: hypothetical protein KBD76_10495 [Bacteriovorax sp.]|jgi:hypothetical protein|nr:hypothetical protein [Bacteriovorax sp.]